MARISVQHCRDGSLTVKCSYAVLLHIQSSQLEYMEKKSYPDIHLKGKGVCDLPLAQTNVVRNSNYNRKNTLNAENDHIHTA